MPPCPAVLAILPGQSIVLGTELYESVLTHFVIFHEPQDFAFLGGFHGAVIIDCLYIIKIEISFICSFKVD